MSGPITNWVAHHRLLAAAIAVVIFAAFAAVLRVSAGSDGTPTAVVSEGEFVDFLQLRGDVKPVRSVAVNAPFQAGFELRVLALAPNGSPVKKGGTVAQFDTATVTKTLDERRSELRRTEAEIEKLRAQAGSQEEQALTAEMRARYAVDRARLDAGAVDLLSAVEAQQKMLALKDAEERLREASARLASTRRANRADLDRAERTRDKALADVREAEANLGAMTLVAPTDGIIALQTNWSSNVSMGGTPPEWRAGDRAWAGAPIAEIPDLSIPLIACRVDEAARGRLSTGLEADVSIDALPDVSFKGRLVNISALARLDISGPRVRNFDLTVELDKSDPRLRPGMSASVRLAVDRIPRAVLVPSAAVLVRDGETVVYVASGRKFEKRVVEVLRRGADNVAVAKGVKPGDKVALRDPLAAEGADQK